MHLVKVNCLGSLNLVHLVRVRSKLSALSKD